MRGRVDVWMRCSRSRQVPLKEVSPGPLQLCRFGPHKDSRWCLCRCRCRSVFRVPHSSVGPSPISRPSAAECGGFLVVGHGLFVVSCSVSMSSELPCFGSRQSRLSSSVTWLRALALGLHLEFGLAEWFI